MPPFEAPAYRKDGLVLTQGSIPNLEREEVLELVGQLEDQPVAILDPSEIPDGFRRILIDEAPSGHDAAGVPTGSEGPGSKRIPKRDGVRSPVVLKNHEDVFAGYTDSISTGVNQEGIGQEAVDGIGKGDLVAQGEIGPFLDRFVDPGLTGKRRSVGFQWSTRLGNSKDQEEKQWRDADP